MGAHPPMRVSRSTVQSIRAPPPPPPPLLPTPPLYPFFRLLPLFFVRSTPRESFRSKTIFERPRPRTSRCPFHPQPRPSLMSPSIPPRRLFPLSRFPSPLLSTRFPTFFLSIYPSALALLAWSTPLSTHASCPSPRPLPPTSERPAPPPSPSGAKGENRDRSAEACAPPRCTLVVPLLAAAPALRAGACSQCVS